MKGLVIGSGILTSDKLIVSIPTHSLMVNKFHLFVIGFFFRSFLDAANDVHSSMEVYQKLCNIAELNAITLDDNKSAYTTEVTWPSSEKYL